MPKNQIPWYKIKAQGDNARIDLYGYLVSSKIFDDEVDPSSFMEDLDALDASTIHVHINSPGGEVASGIAIYNALRSHPATIVTHVDAEAASMASVVAMAGDQRLISSNAWMMIHDPWAAMAGNAREFRKMADVLEMTGEILADIYVDRAGVDKQEVTDAMAEETWYNANDALEFGLVDEISGDVAVAACRIEDGRYKHTPAELLMQSKEIPMTEKAPKKAEKIDAPEVAAPDNAVDVEAVKAAAVKAEREREKVRRESIHAQIGSMVPGDKQIAEIYNEAMANPEATPEEVNAKVVKVIVARELPDSSDAQHVPTAAARIGTTVDSREKFREGALLALSARCNVSKDHPDLSGNEYRSYSQVELARAALAQISVSTRGMDKRQILGAAMSHSDSDYPLLLENIATKALQQGWDDSPVTYPQWTVQGTLPDFKLSGRPAMEAFPYLDQTLPGATIQHATIGETGESIQLLTYSNLFSVNRQALINDDTNAFSGIPLAMGEAARGTINYLAYAPLINNQIMGDGIALFDAQHNNIAAAAAPGTDSIDDMRTLMATQKAVGTNTAGTANEGKTARNVGARLIYLLGAVRNEGALRTVMASQFYVDFGQVDANIPNSVQNLATVITDPILDGSATPFYYYGAAGRRTVEVAFLDGNSQPYLENRQGWSVDGVEFKVRIDVGIAPLDYRGLVQNPWTGA